MKQAVHLSEIDESFLKVSSKTKIHMGNQQDDLSSQAALHGDDFGSYMPLNVREPMRQGTGLYVHEL